MPPSQPDWSQPTAYERWYASSLGRAYEASLTRVLQPWLSHTSGCSVLDIGCGPGLEMESLFPPGARIIGLDCSLNMARRAFERNRQAGQYRPLVIGSATRIPLADGLFDLAFSLNCLEFVDDRQAAFREIARILRPSGTAIVGVLNRISVWEWTRKLWGLVSRKPYYRGRFFRVNEVERLCTEVGLQIEEVKHGVYFPPIPPGPFQCFYNWLDEWFQRHRLGAGAVILFRVRS
jgi:SAM-dependent methyltransferase